MGATSAMVQWRGALLRELSRISGAGALWLGIKLLGKLEGPHRRMARAGGQAWQRRAALSPTHLFGAPIVHAGAREPGKVIHTDSKPRVAAGAAGLWRRGTGTSAGAQPTAHRKCSNKRASGPKTAAASPSHAAAQAAGGSRHSRRSRQQAAQQAQQAHRSTQSLPSIHLAAASSSFAFSAARLPALLAWEGHENSVSHTGRRYLRRGGGGRDGHVGRGSREMLLPCGHTHRARHAHVGTHTEHATPPTPATPSPSLVADLLHVREQGGGAAAVVVRGHEVDAAAAAGVEEGVPPARRAAMGRVERMRGGKLGHKLALACGRPRPRPLQTAHGAAPCRPSSGAAVSTERGIVRPSLPTHHLNGSFSMQSEAPHGAAAGEPRRSPYLRGGGSGRQRWASVLTCKQALGGAAAPSLTAPALPLTGLPAAAATVSRCRLPPGASGAPGPSRGWAAWEEQAGTVAFSMNGAGVAGQ